MHVSWHWTLRYFTNNNIVGTIIIYFFTFQKGERRTYYEAGSRFSYFLKEVSTYIILSRGHDVPVPKYNIRFLTTASLHIYIFMYIRTADDHYAETLLLYTIIILCTHMIHKIRCILLCTYDLSIHYLYRVSYNFFPYHIQHVFTIYFDIFGNCLIWSVVFLTTFGLITPYLVGTNEVTNWYGTNRSN